MRSDYMLYILSVVFFIIAALAAVYVAEPVSRNLYVVSTVLVGLLIAIGGYFFRPKVKSAATDQPVPPALQEPAPPEPAPPQQTSIVEAPVAIVPKAEAPLMETPKSEQPIVVTEPTEPAQVSTPVAQVPEAVATVDFTRIRGINSKRADQLKAFGINSFDDLAKASATDLSVRLQVSEKIVKMWIGSAKKLTK